MGKVYFLFGVHNHQPVGNFPGVFEEAYHRCYYPFLSLMDQFPEIKFSLHNTGPLYDWILENKKEYIDLLKKMAKRRQVEVISGGYYEPILSLICDEDKKGQVNLMNKFIKNEFKSEPGGIWAAERIWEPYLARIINECGLKYTFLDDTHFRYAGLSEKEFMGYYTTEDCGKQIFVFPISKTLRYKVPFSQAQEAIDILNGFAKEKDVLVTLFDDGEKFGLWPHTYEWVYEKEWLKKFLTSLSKSTVIETITASEAIEKFSSKGIVYLPTASYEEMGEWVLEPKSYHIYEGLKKFLQENNKYEQFKDFVRGGFFRNFYRKYPRLNYMHKRMLTLSSQINEKEGKKDTKMFTDLWKAQCNCGWWHGIFGGFYLGHIRAAIYENLINAERALDSKHSKKKISIDIGDIDMDGHEEAIVKNKDMVCCFSEKGGSLLELSLRSPAYNLLNTITRQEESYHRKIRENVKNDPGLATIHENVSHKEEGLDQFLIYDKYQRLGLIDHLLEKDITLGDFNLQKGVHTLSNDIYKQTVRQKKDKVDLQYDYCGKDLGFSKQISFSLKSGFDAAYKFNKKEALNKYDFGIEFNLSLQSLKSIFKKDGKKDITLDHNDVWNHIEYFEIVDYYKKILLTFKFDLADVFAMPLYSVSSSEAGFEKVYQQMTILFIPKDSKDNFRLSFNIKNKR